MLRIVQLSQSMWPSLQAWLTILQARVDGLLPGRRFAVEGQPEEKKKLPGWAIALIVAGVLLCVIPACIFGLLLLLGPAIGNVFSNINDQLQ